MLARIKPSSPAKQKVVCGLFFRKEKGWYEVPDSAVDALEAEPLHDTAPDGPFVFDVCTPEEAQRIADSEYKREDPRGTVAAPIRMPGALPPVAPEAPPPTQPTAPRSRANRRA